MGSTFARRSTEQNLVSRNAVLCRVRRAHHVAEGCDTVRGARSAEVDATRSRSYTGNDVGPPNILGENKSRRTPFEPTQPWGLRGRGEGQAGCSAPLPVSCVHGANGRSCDGGHGPYLRQAVHPALAGAGSQDVPRHRCQTRHLELIPNFALRSATEWAAAVG